jgi:flagellar biosynthesis/type III secretory pathway M-ring protein FliF/YscJ
MKPGTALELELTDGSKLSGYLEEIRADTVSVRNSKAKSGAPREIAFSQIRRARRTSHTPLAAWIVVGVVAGVAIAVIVVLTKYLAQRMTERLLTDATWRASRRYTPYRRRQRPDTVFRQARR